MELKILALPSGNGKVYSTTDKLADYIKLGYVDTGETIEVEVTDPSKEVVEMLLEDSIVTHLRYKGDNEWRAIAGGGSGTDTYKVKVDGTDTAEYLEGKISAGTNIVINKVNDKIEVSCDIADELPTGGATGQVLAKKTTADGDVEWVNQSGGSGAGVTVYADLAALKAVDATAYTDVQTVQVATLGLYKFQPASTLTGDDVNVITPTTGSAAGRWILQSTKTSQSDTTTLQAWSETNRPLVKIGSGVVKTLNTTLGKKIVCVGSSVMLGIGLATPTTQSYPALQLAELNTDDTGWTLKNFSISGETSGSGFSRLLNDIQAEHPDIVWIGYSPNNNGLATKTTDADCIASIYEFERNIDKITRALEQQGIPYLVSGMYPKGDFTALAYKYLKQLNINLQLKYGLRYINFLGSLDDGTGKFKASLVQADLTHPNATGAGVISSCIPRAMLIYNRYNTLKDIPTFSTKNGIILGNDTTTAKPLLIADTIQNRCFTIQEEVYNDSNLTANKVLLSVNYSAKTLNVIKNSSGYVDLLYNDVSTLTVASTTKFKEGFNTIQLTYDATSGIFELWLNGLKVGASAVITSFYFQYFSVGGSANAANNATGVEFRNVAKWCNKMTDDELVTLANGTMLPGSLEYFNSLSSIPSGAYLNEGGGTIKARLTVLSSTWTSSDRGSKTVTDTEKTKLANSTSGTFTTNDGKTITVVGGMITSIV